MPDDRPDIQTAVESMLSPDGEPVIALTVDTEGTRRYQGTRFRKAKPVYLTQTEGRRLARQLMEASGFNPGVILDEEEIRLRKVLARADLDAQERQEGEASLAVVGLVRRLWRVEES
jgi:hypothetical protein